ncbi:uncharacterized protein CC84DRAFT_64091 [Paraphaeosphaeria sporulosa]|uniref:Uncharacterized protein n=1 Tax=Paraphaeosphaeria sporulosa TaxID=1460663 RepID=A0A177CXP2_9PLEO|nr:uncharacterized protein CC84DRAFT_64091 [Paraphaeosphaeria sporulosa]OAG11971.1 hypothetical protein CC84DRAFT_64091 [Paraphaeosphaeria sporulosa]
MVAARLLQSAFVHLPSTAIDTLLMRSCRSCLGIHAMRIDSYRWCDQQNCTCRLHPLSLNHINY